MATHSSTSGLENPMDGGAWCRLLSMGLQSWAQLSEFSSLHFISIILQKVDKSIKILSFANDRKPKSDFLDGQNNAPPS